MLCLLLSSESATLAFKPMSQFPVSIASEVAGAKAALGVETTHTCVYAGSRRSGQKPCNLMHSIIWEVSVCKHPLEKKAFILKKQISIT